MNCSESQAELPLFVGGDLESSSHDRVAAHLESCSVCRAALEAATQSRQVLRERLHQTADLHGAFVATAKQPSVWPNLQERLRSEGLIHSGPSLSGQSSPGQSSPVLSAARQSEDHQIHNTDFGPAAALPATSARRGRLLRWVPGAAAAAAFLLFGTLAGQFLMETSVLMEAPAGPGVSSSGGSALIDSPPLVVVTPATTVSKPVKHNGGLREVTDPRHSFIRGATPFSTGSLSEVMPLYRDPGNRFFNSYRGRGAQAASASGAPIEPLPEATRDGWY